MSGLRTAVLLFLIALALSVLVHGVSADGNVTNVTNGSYVIVYTPPPDYVFPQYASPGTYRIMQGQDVYLNDTIDISGMGHGELELAWFGKYDDYPDPQYTISFSLFKSELMNFYIDPKIFASRPGMWYQYYGNTTFERNGNLRAFNVIDTYRNVTMTYPNGTVINQTQYVRNASVTKPQVITQVSILPEVHVADYLLAVGVPLPVDTGGPAQVWIFGRVDQAYNSTPDSNMTFDAGTFVNWEPGSYTMIVQHAGRNGDFDVRYNGSALQYKNGWNGVQNVDVRSLQPRMVLGQLVQLLSNTDDDYQTYTLELQQPDIRIVSIDDVWLESKLTEFHLDPAGDITLKDVRGYTNLRNDTVLTAVLDKDYVTDQQVGRYTSPVDTYRTGPGNRTVFRAYVPIIWSTIPLGMHTVTVSGPFGAYAKNDFPVELLPQDSFRPNTSLKYTGDEDPWKPNLTTPTPVVVTQVVTVTVTITPSQEEIKQKSMDAVMQIINDTIVPAIEAIGGCLIVFFLARFVYRSWKRRMWLKR